MVPIFLDHPVLLFTTLETQRARSKKLHKVKGMKTEQNLKKLQ